MKPIHLLFLCILFSCNQKSVETASTQRVNEKRFMKLAGVEQYVEITGSADTLPVLLFIHGGPGWPQTPMLRYFNSDLVKDLIVATWDQRGCGKTLENDSTIANITLEQIVEDAHELTGFLRARFKKEKIFLAGFSWGSVVGMELLRKYPGDYLAYAGISQVVNTSKGMEATQKWLKEKATAANDTASLSVLTQLERKDSLLCKTSLNCFIKQYELVSRYNGAVFDKASEKEVEKAMTAYDDYRNYDWNRGFFHSATNLEPAVFSADFTGITSLPVPVFFFSGRHDWNIPAVLVEEFYQRLDAPRKELIWFEKSGHGPLEEEPALFNRMLKEKFLGILKP